MERASRMAVVSQVWDFDNKRWMTPEPFSDHGWNDECLAEVSARREARDRLEELFKQRGLSMSDRSIELPWLERIMVCPLLPGLGLKGSDHYAIDDRSMTITIGLE